MIRKSEFHLSLSAFINGSFVFFEIYRPVSVSEISCFRLLFNVYFETISMILKFP